MQFVGDDILKTELSIDKKVTVQGEIGENITYTIYENGYMKIFGKGEMYKDVNNIFSDDMKKKVTFILFESHNNEFMNIGKLAFDGFANVTAVDMSCSVIEIGEYAFRGCKRLGRVFVPECVEIIGNGAFSKCDNLRKAVIGNGVRCMGTYLFEECYALEELTLPYAGRTREGMSYNSSQEYTNYETVKSLFASGISFNGYAINRIIVTGGVCIPKDAFSNISSLECVELPDTIMEIGDFAFRGCGNLTEITIPVNVKRIGSSAFGFCFSLKNIDIPDSVEYIDALCFTDCTDLEEIVIPDNVKMIGKEAFIGCNKLRKVVIGKNVSELGEGVFSECFSLEDLTLPYNYYESIDGEKIPLLGMNSCDQEYIGFSVKKVTVNSGEYIPKGVFSVFVLLNELILCETVKIIESGAFAGNTELEFLTICSKEISPDQLDNIDMSNLTLRCYKDSSVHRYAVEKGISYQFINDGSGNKAEVRFSDLADLSQRLMFNFKTEEFVGESTNIIFDEKDFINF